MMIHVELDKTFIIKSIIEKTIDNDRWLIDNYLKKERTCSEIE